MDQLQAKLGSLLARPMEDAATKELAEAAKARVDVLRSLLRTPAVVGDDEYERLLRDVFDATSKLLKREPTNHRGPESEEGWKVAGFQATAPDREFRGGGCSACTVCYMPSSTTRRRARSCSKARSPSRRRR